MSNPVKPLGGTELMYNELKRRISPQYFQKFSIFNYASYADFNKPTVYWNQLSYDQEAVQFLLDLQLVEKINYFDNYTPEFSDRTHPSGEMEFTSAF